MIIGVGIDIVKTARIAKLLEKFGSKFENKIFTKNEISWAQERSNQQVKINFYAKRFAAKEAFSKAIGLGIGRGVDFLDIEIINDKNGRPKLKLQDGARKFLQKYLGKNGFKIDVSLSDEGDMACAVVTICEVY
jgi:holo-[acyl-carrier protein] synthase